MAADRFAFDLTGPEKQYLLDIVRLSIRRDLGMEEGEGLPEPPTPRLTEKFGAFVTLKTGGRLRGCIGHIMGDEPLNKTVYAMARSAAFQDPRFPSLSEEEYDRLSVEISVLSPLTQCPDPMQVEVGRHGLLMQHGPHQGLLLPQVPVEWGWDREQFLAQTCGKAGMRADCWKDPQTRIFWFEAAIFGD
jgi:hypothetical protein